MVSFSVYDYLFLSCCQSALYQFLASSEVSLELSYYVKLVGIVLLNIFLQYYGISDFVYSLPIYFSFNLGF